MELDTFDIGVSWRWMGKHSESGTMGEIILYDNTPGGAGFVKEGFENLDKVAFEAQNICENCNCLEACYNCLKNYSNQRCRSDKLIRLCSDKLIHLWTQCCPER
jgi:ATP-dependent helicase YprA (DUF1998 family)